LLQLHHPDPVAFVGPPLIGLQICAPWRRWRQWRQWRQIQVFWPSDWNAHRSDEWGISLGSVSQRRRRMRRLDEAIRLAAGNLGREHARASSRLVVLFSNGLILLARAVIGYQCHDKQERGHQGADDIHRHIVDSAHT
jgi:hypothetical protein